MIPIEDQYPSTGDLSLIAGAQDDLTLNIMLGGRQRVFEGHTTGAYINDRAKSVCAIGSILAEEGWTEAKLDSVSVADVLEMHLSDAAKEAIALLNIKALEFHPEAEGAGWSGPFEWVNQCYEDWADPRSLSDEDRDTRTEILRIYDAAIADRAGDVVNA